MRKPQISVREGIHYSTSREIPTDVLTFFFFPAAQIDWRAPGAPVQSTPAKFQHSLADGYFSLCSGLSPPWHWVVSHTRSTGTAFPAFTTSSLHSWHQHQRGLPSPAQAWGSLEAQEMLNVSFPFNHEQKRHCSPSTVTRQLWQVT